MILKTTFKKLMPSFLQKHWQLLVILLVGFASFTAMPNMAKASHIIGGEMNYRCLGGNTFEVSLTVYRDCFYADPAAIFDAPASIGVYEAATNNLVEALSIEFIQDDTLTAVLSDTCLFVPGDVCVHTTTYTETLTLPFKEGGYVISYQRCCRNETINNIVDPFNTGATYTTRITERALLECNSGARFKDWPPLFICVNEPIDWDHSAFDPDGDSLVYKLCTPLQGATFEDNQPVPPPPPPYDTVVWANPYNLENVLGGNPLMIDSETGVMTGTPNIKGQFVVGICIEEYRDGELISTNRRDFQYNVGDCLEVTPVISNSPDLCDLEVTFMNDSEESDNYEWIFGDPTDPTAGSLEENPTYTYPDTGSYTVTLIAEPGSQCQEILEFDFHIKNSTLIPDFDMVFTSCTDSLIIDASDSSINPDANITDYQWLLSDGQMSTDENPSFVVFTQGPMSLTLTVTSEDNCSETIEKEFIASILDGSVVDTLNSCPGTGINVNPTIFTNPAHTYSWTPTDGLDDATAANPIATPNATTLYTVEIDDPIYGCMSSFSVLVDIEGTSAPILTESTAYCTETFTIQADSSDTVLSLQWSDTLDFSNVIGTTSSISVSDSGLNTYYLAAEDASGCTFIDSVKIMGGTLNVDVDAPSLACLNQGFTISATNTDAEDLVTYNWLPENQVISGQGTSEATFRPSTIGQTTYSVALSNQFECSEVRDFNVFVLLSTSPTDFDITQDCDGFSFDFTNSHFNANFYTWDFGDINNPTASAAGPIANYTYTQAGTYTVRLFPNDGLPCDLQAVEKTIVVPSQVVEPDFDFTVESCGDSAVINFIDISQQLQGSITDWAWDFGNGVTADVQNPSITFYQNEVINVQLSVTTNEACVIDFNRNFDLAPYFMDVSTIPATLSKCSVNDLALNVGGNPNYSYQWSPANTLDDPNAPNPMSSTTEAVVYNVTVTDDAAGCQVERTIDVSVPDDMLDADFEWTYLDCVQNVTVNLVPLSTYSDGTIVSWQWTLSNGVSSNQEEFTTTINNNTPTDITLTVTADDGCTATFTQTLNASVLDLDLPANMYLCGGTSVVLNQNGNDNYEYTWSPATGLNDATIAKPTASPTVSTTYTVTVFDPNSGCNVQQSIAIEVGQALNADFSLDYQDCTGPAIVQFTDNTQYNSDIVNVAWMFGNGESFDIANPTLIFDENSTITVNQIVEAADGCRDTLNQVVDINIIDFESNTVTVCNGQATELNPNPNLAWQYNWSPTTGNLGDPSAANPSVAPAVTTTYTVTITDLANGGCEVVQQVVAEVPNYNIEVDFDIAYSSCADTALVQFTSLSTADIEIIAWDWTFGNGMTSTEENPQIMLEQDQDLMVMLTVTTADGCQYSLDVPQAHDVGIVDISNLILDDVACEGNTIILNENGNPDYFYNWSPSNSLSNPNATSPVAAPNGPTTYTVTVTHVSSIGTCEIVEEVNIDVPPLPAVSASGETLICEEEGLISANSSSLGAYIWSTSSGFVDTLSNTANLVIMPDSEGTTYYVQITDENGCNNTDEITVFNRQVDIDIENELLLCLGDSIILQATNLDPNDELTYDWAPNSQIINGDGTDAITINPTTPSLFTLDVSNQYDCSTQESIEIDINDFQGMLDLNVNQDTIFIEEGDSVQIFTLNDPNFTYEWAPKPLVDDPDSPSPFVFPEETTNFIVTVQDLTTGCSAGLFFTVVINPRIELCEEPFVFIPNSFSPNGDNVNEVLEVHGNTIEEMHLVIYNRWGQQVFESFSQDIKWDGTFRGETLKPDVFGYYLEVKCINGLEYFKKGNINLLR